MTNVRRPAHTLSFGSIAAAVSLVVIALLAAADLAHGTPADVPAVHASIGIPQGADTTAGDRDERWAADESAQGTRPDSVH